jgi:hypothetical protein
MTTSPSKEKFFEALCEMLDEFDWGKIDWDGEDREDFAQLLSDAWDRAAKRMEVEIEHVCPFCHEPYRHPGGCLPGHCRLIANVLG